MRKEVIGDATLYLGDCLEILPTLPKVDAVITDPPYGVNFAGSTTKHSEASGIGYASFEDSPEAIASEIVPRLMAALAIARRGVITPGIKCARLYPTPDAEGVIWYPSGANSGPWGFVTHQPIYYYGKCAYLSTGRGRRPTGFATTEAAEENGHPCPKPIGQMRWLVHRGAIEGEIVLDPFMGSGTTGVACIHSRNPFIGIEREPAYFDIACRRIEQAYKQRPLFDAEPPRKPEQLGLEGAC